MTEKNYLPEGLRFGTAKNNEYTANLSGLETAMRNQVILEALALRCDNDMTLEFNVGGVRCVMPKEESCMAFDGEDIKDIAVITRVGKCVCFKVINIVDDKKGNVYAVLSRRAAQMECYNESLLNLEAGDIVDAKVTHMEHFGAFVDIGCGIVSLLPIDAISVSRISHPSDRFEVGMYIKAVVKSIDKLSGRIYLTHKELLGTWRENADNFEVGTTVSGVVRSIEEYGIFVELLPNLAGLAEYKEGVEPGQSASVYIKNIFPDRMKVKLVLIGECERSDNNKKEQYYIDCDKIEHIDHWRYSPPECERVIETVF